jgi:hypothetical protein
MHFFIGLQAIGENPVASMLFLKGNDKITLIKQIQSTEPSCGGRVFLIPL